MKSAKRSMSALPVDRVDVILGVGDGVVESEKRGTAVGAFSVGKSRLVMPISFR